ncbi:hypothetical protein AN416_38085 (plasmid) [Paraburkholderia caribensis]|nr:hypothetical protein AN416_38085 [Paraburkholderia caribensis]AUT57897.1 hypothetical protein C2L66_39060 [Paraburkholderia caribensis]
MTVHLAQLATSAVAAPALAFARSGGGLARAQVHADLTPIEQGGYGISLGTSRGTSRSPRGAEAKTAAVHVYDVTAVLAWRSSREWQERCSTNRTSLFTLQ